MKYYFFVLFSFFLLCGIHSQDCGNFSVKDEKKTKKLEKKFRERSIPFKVQGFDAFDVAVYLLGKGDTLSKKWFLFTINKAIKEYEKERRLDIKAEKLFKIGVSYYYTENFKTAEVFLIKSVKAKYSSNCNLYFLYLCNQKLGKKEEAEKWKKEFYVGK